MPVGSEPRRPRGSAAWRIVCLLALVLAGGCDRTAAEAAYVPGLGEIMSATQMRHSKLWFAGEAGSWELAAYEVDELEEGFADAVRFHPTHKDAPRPLSELLPELTAGPVAALRDAIRDQSPEAFASAYDALTEGCNACHEASRFSFNVVVRPTTNPWSNQRFGP